MKNWILIILVAIVFVGCDEPITLDLDQTPSRFVIEGELTDVAGRQFVRITKSDGFYQAGVTERIANAEVSVKDDTGEETQFIHNPTGSEDSVGYYFPAGNYVGVVGRTYTLTVDLDGITYTGSDKMMRVTAIDSIGYQPNRFRERDEPSDGKIWELLLYAREPQDTEDNYLFKFYRNDSLIYTSETDVYIFNDYGIGENIEGFPSPVYYAPGDKARVEMYSISREGFLFYNDLINIMNSDGGMFSPPPANPRSNITGGALGFFQVSSMTYTEVTVESDDQ
jgi:hypothetical protein